MLERELSPAPAQLAEQPTQVQPTEQAEPAKKPRKKRCKPMSEWRDKRHRNRPKATGKKAKVGRPKKRGRKPKPKKAAPTEVVVKAKRKHRKSSLAKPVERGFKPVHVWAYDYNALLGRYVLEKITVLPSAAGLMEWLSGVGIYRTYWGVLYILRQFESGKYGLHKPFHGYVVLRDAEQVLALEMLGAGAAAK